DAVGQSLGFTLSLGCLATVREILGFGTWFGSWLGWRVIPEGVSASVWSNWVIMILPPGAFLALGILVGAVNWASAARGKSAVRTA
ncbi:MAG: Rnf-Nqr domain containing protein, partial [Kiritimatiellia bacterium]|nr:Rnf-Nqr domain containing protein [Kiritimatiellia bacterium]